MGARGGSFPSTMDPLEFALRMRRDEESEVQAEEAQEVAEEQHKVNGEFMLVRPLSNLTTPHHPCLDESCESGLLTPHCSPRGTIPCYTDSRAVLTVELHLAASQ